jgi:hypothetical protein
MYGGRLATGRSPDTAAAAAAAAAAPSKHDYQQKLQFLITVLWLELLQQPCMVSATGRSSTNRPIIRVCFGVLILLAFS